MRHKHHRRNSQEYLDELKEHSKPKSLVQTYADLGSTEKGSRQSKIKFNPLKDVSDSHRTDVEDWTGGYGANDRERIKPMPENAKKRALDKLHAITDVKKHPHTGERMFLMHRGMQEEEYLNHFDTVSPHPNDSTSWTPNYKVAHSFASDYTDANPNLKARVVSAWVPESKIRHIPNAIGSRSRDVDNASWHPSEPVGRSHRHSEHEVIVDAHRMRRHYAYQPREEKQKELHSKINERAGGKLAASEDIENDLDKGEPKSAAKGLRNLAVTAALVSGAHEMGLEPQRGRTPATTAEPAARERSVEGTNLDPNMRNRPAYKQAQAEFEGRGAASAPVDPTLTKEHTLGSISDVESSGGKNLNHAPLPKNGIHQGESAFGKYGLTPLLIRETIKKHPDLKEQYGHLVNFKGKLFHEGMAAANKGGKLEDEIASRHYDRLASHFGHNPAHIGYAWLNGITGTKRAKKNGRDINSHWHVKKIMNAYKKRRKR